MRCNATKCVFTLDLGVAPASCNAICGYRPDNEPVSRFAFSAGFLPFCGRCDRASSCGRLSAGERKAVGSLVGLVTRQFLPSAQYSASARKSVGGWEFPKPTVSDSYALRGGACNHQDSPIGSGIPWWQKLAAVNAIGEVPLPRSSPRYPVELSQFPEGLLNEAFRKLFRSHAAGGSVRRDSLINLA
jgi:hypothetical protein